MDVLSLIQGHRRSLVSIPAGATVEECVSLLTKENVGALIVCNQSGTAVGILSERDIVRGLASRGPKVLKIRAEDLMSREMITCRPQDHLRDVAPLMIEYGIRHVPVVKDGRVVDVISMRDLVRHRLAELELEANVLRDRAIARVGQRR